MFNPSREQARRFYFDTWAKHRASQPLTDLEKIALTVMLLHPEYHSLLDKPDHYVDKDYSPEAGQTNPFLHMSMHVAIHEQLTIDQPQGIREHYKGLCEHTQDQHAAEHEMMDCLGEMIWHAQRHQTNPNPDIYFACLNKKRGLSATE